MKLLSLPSQSRAQSAPNGSKFNNANLESMAFGNGGKCQTSSGEISLLLKWKGEVA